MNHVYRVILNIASGAWQAVSEVSKGSGKVKSQRRRQRKSTAGALLFISTQLCAAGLPQGGVVSTGSGTIAQPNSNTLNVTQSSNRMAVDWQSFSIGQGNTVNFIQPGSSAIVLNRVIGNDVSSIQGAIRANGQVFLINPNGVIFTPTAQVNVGSLVASTRNITNAQFNAGNYHFEGTSNSAIINQGNITAADGGYVVLIAARIENTGSISADKGFAGLASGKLVTLDMGGPVKLKVEQGAIDSLISNGGIIRANGGHILLTARAAGDLAASVVNNRGIITASSIESSGGKIVLLGDSITNSGQLAANGATGGGEILVGGDWQGSNTELYPHASRVTLTDTSDISAQATQQGDGGKIVLWSSMDKANGATSVAGRLNAESRGKQSAGGKIETSGKSLVIAESAEVKTKGGEWLLDPVNIAIDSTLAGTISTALGSGNVTISTSGSNTPSTATGESGTDGDIAVNSSITKISGSDSTLTFKAHRNITLASGVTVSSTANKLNMVLWANQDGVGDGRIEVGNSGSTLTNITTNGGGVWMGGGAGSTSWTPFSGATAINVGDGYALSSSGSTLASNYSNGISLLATRITTGGGNVALYGDSESSLLVNVGLRMQYAATSATHINAGAGKVYLDGKTASGGTYNFGLDIQGTTLTSTSTAADALKLKSSANTTGNDQAVVAGNTTINASQGGVVLDLSTQSATDSAWDPGADSSITSKDLTITSSGKLRLGSASDNKTTMVVSGTTTVNAQSGIAIEMGSSANQLGTLQVSGTLGQASITNSNALTVNGITGASGTLAVETLSGNLTLAGNVSTSSTATNAIVLNAGKSTAAGTSTGGDLIVSASPTLSTGTGGRATIYTGSVAGSTGLTNLVGSGSGRFRYNSDESASNFSTALAAGNYAIYRERPTVTVNVASQAKTYDGLAYTGTQNATATGLVNGDSATDVMGGLSYTINSGNTAKNAGTYAIAATGNSGVGYNLALNNGTLTINKAALTVTADNKTKTYGDANPTLTSTLSGFANGETASTAGITGAASLSTTATQTTNAGTVAITTAAGTLAANNYTFTNLANGTLTINKAALTVTADNKTKTYGEANPALTTTLSGFKNGETAETAGVSGSGNANTTATQATGVGTAVITAGAGTLAASNYSFSNLVNGTLTINAATANTNDQVATAISNAISSVTTGISKIAIFSGITTTTIGTLTLSNQIILGNISFSDGYLPFSKLSTAELKNMGATPELLVSLGYTQNNKTTLARNDIGGNVTLSQSLLSEGVLDSAKASDILGGPTPIPTSLIIYGGAKGQTGTKEAPNLNLQSLFGDGLDPKDTSKGETSIGNLNSIDDDRFAHSSIESQTEMYETLGGYFQKDSSNQRANDTMGAVGENYNDKYKNLLNKYGVKFDQNDGRAESLSVLRKELSIWQLFDNGTDQGFNLWDLKNSFGYSAKEIVSGLNLNQNHISFLKTIGFNASELKEAFKEARLGAKELSAFFEPQDMKSAFTAAELKSAKFTFDYIASCDYPKQQLSDIGYTLNDLRNNGYTLEKLKVAGFTANELKASGSTAKELQEVGYSLADLVAGGYKADQLTKLGYSTQQMKEAGFSASELKVNGSTGKALKAAGYSASELRRSGYKIDELSKLGYSGKEMKDAGFSASELNANGSTGSDLKAAGFSAEDLKKEITVAKSQFLKDAGYSAEDLKKAGFDAKSLKDAGYSGSDLYYAGFGIKEIMATGITVKQLFNNVPNSALQEAGVSAEELKSASSSAAIIPLKSGLSINSSNVPGSNIPSGAKRKK